MRTDPPGRPPPVKGQLWVCDTCVDGEEDEPTHSTSNHANERTFLAWIRTSLALIGGGVALSAVQIPMATPARITAEIILLGLGLLLPVLAWRNWAVTERAMRRSEPLPGSIVSLPLGVGIFAVAVVIAFGMLT